MAVHKIFRNTLVALVGLVCVIYGLASEEVKARTVSTKYSCINCHRDFTAVLQKGHPPVKGKDITACLVCHPPKSTGKPELNAFSARLHRAHQCSKQKLDCLVCHTWQPARIFGLPMQKWTIGKSSRKDMDLLKQIFNSWSSSVFLDALHAKKNVTCKGCHGNTIPISEATIENDRCLSCHGGLEQLTAKTSPLEFPDRNPHKSHLGEINCTVCHHAHRESEVYCLGCHKTFQMKIPGVSIKSSKSTE
jgi:DNA-directed RNA polymerase subunit RPC12/RpoP